MNVRRMAFYVALTAQILVGQSSSSVKPATQGHGPDIELVGTKYLDELPKDFQAMLNERFMNPAPPEPFECSELLVPTQTSPETEELVIKMLDPIMKSLGFQRFEKNEYLQIRVIAKKKYPQMHARLPVGLIVYWTGGPRLASYLEDITCWSVRQAKEKYKAKVRQMWVSYIVSSNFDPAQKAFKTKIRINGPYLLGSSNWLDKGDMNILKENIDGTAVLTKLGNTVESKIAETASDFGIKLGSQKAAKRR